MAKHDYLNMTASEGYAHSAQSVRVTEQPEKMINAGEKLQPRKRYYNGIGKI